MRLYEIAQDYKAFLEAVENGDIPEEAIADSLESIEAILEDKADNIACVIKNLTAEAEAIKAEEKALAARRNQKEREIKSLKDYLANALLNSGYTKIETARNRISFRKSKKVEIDDEAAFIEWAMSNRDDLLKYELPTISRTAIKEAIEGGDEIAGARIEISQNIQIK